MADRKTVMLVDGTSFVFRAFHAMPPLQNDRGVPTGAVYGFITMLGSILDAEKPAYAAVAFDTAEPTFRETLFEQYKANRGEVPEEIAPQFPLVRRWLDAMGICALEAPGFEADDILATLARQAADEGAPVLIVSGDKDLLQMVDDRIRVLSAHGANRRTYDADAVRERYGVPPGRIPDILALMGDASDNIPGVPMIGEKTAASLIGTYGSLEGLYEHVDEVKGKRGEMLRANRDNAFRSRELATLRQDVPLYQRVSQLAPEPPDTGRLRAFYEEMGFSTLLRRLDESPAAGEPPSRDDYRIVATEADLQSLADRMRQCGRFAIDTETTGLQPRSSTLVGISVACDPDAAWYIPTGHSQGARIPVERVRSVLGPILEDPSVAKIAHNAKFDAQVLRHAGLEVRGWAFDTLLAACLVEPTGDSLSLDSLSRKHTRKPKLSFEETIGRHASIAEAAVETAGAYACRDADCTRLLYEHYRPEVSVEPVRTLFEEIEMPLLEVLLEMEWRGVRVRPDVLRRQSEELSRMEREVEERVYREAGGRFNINSPKQLGEILYDRLGLLKGRKRSTRAEVLERLAAQGNNLAEFVLEYRQLAKLRSTYLDALPGLIHPETGRVHTSYSQTVATTGRISSSDPNLQNIPIRTELGRRVREAFVPDEGHVFLSADYSQIELRVVAHFTEDPGLVEAFRKGEDIHQRTAADLYGVPLEDVTPEQRTRAKAINFGLHYGMTDRGLANRLGIGVEEAADYIGRYFERYPLVRDHIDRTVAAAKETGYVTTLLGRRVYIPDIRSSRFQAAENAKRVAINAPIQGTAAEMLKKAMLAVDRGIAREGLSSRMILTVHDEVILEVPEQELETARRLVTREMESAFPLRVPVTVNTKAGPNWAELG